MKFNSNIISSQLAAIGMGVLALGGVAVTPAHAQHSFVLEEVLVVARRREEQLQKTPVAVTAISTEELRAAQIANLGDLPRVVPGLSRRDGAKTAGFTIRGVGQYRSDLRLDPGVGVYVDSIYLPRNDTQLAEIINMDSVQVLRGPQGTLFGRNTIGGAILMNTVKPGPDFTGSAKLELGDLDRTKARLNVSGPLMEDTLYGGITLDRSLVDGYREDAETGEDYGDVDRASVLGQLRYEGGDDFVADLLVFYSKQDEKVSPQTCLMVDPDAALQQFTAPGNATSFQELCDRSWALNDDEEVLLDRMTPTWEQENYMAGLTLAWDVGDVTVKSITGYLAQDGIVTSNDTDATNLFSLQNMGEVMRQYEANGLPADDQERLFLSQEFQVLGTAFDEFVDYTVGVFYSREEIDNESDGIIVGPGGWMGFPGATINDPVVPLNQGFRDFAITDFTNESLAVFGQLLFNFSDNLELSLGGRYTYEDKEANQVNYVSDAESFGPLSRAEFDALADFIHPMIENPDLPRVDKEDDWDVFTPAVSLSYFLDEGKEGDFVSGGMLYASGSKGFKAGGFTPFGEEVQTFEPEELITYELGYKLDLWDNRMRLNGAVYYSEYEEIQLAVIRTDNSVFPPTAVQGITNAGEATISGAEVEFSVMPVEGLYLGLNASYIDAEYDEFFDEDSDGNLLDRSDEDFAYIPETTYSVTAQYDWQSPIGLITPRLSGHYVDEIFFGLDALAKDQPEAYLDDYTVWNFRLAWRSEAEEPTWEVAGWVHNLADEDYFTSGVISVDGIGIASLVPGVQRTWGVEFYYNW